MRRVCLSLIATLALLALPVAPAIAAPGSAIDEYREHIPGGAGDQPSDEVGGAGSGAGTLPPGTVQALAAEGADGVAAARLAKATGPGRGQGEGQAGAGENATTPDASSGGGGIGALIDQIAGGSGEGDEGMGAVLPVVLGLSVLAALLFLLIGRRRTHAGGA